MTLENSNRASGAAIGFILATVLFVVLALAVKLSVNVPPVDADRGEVLGKALADLRVSEDKSLNTAGWVDQSRGVVRLPIDTAIQLAAQAWQNPGQARADLRARAEKAAAALPVAPAKPSVFE
jgi:hypothetical protein